MLCEVLGHEAARASRVGPRTRRRKANPSVAKTTLSRALETDEAAMTSRGSMTTTKRVRPRQSGRIQFVHADSSDGDADGKGRWQASARACEPITAALLYGQRGWRVFPCRRKTPLPPHGFKDATTDPEAIEVWWRKFPSATIGVATGLLSGVVVLDIDNNTRGPSGWDSLEELGLPLLIDTPIAHTPHGGAHYYFGPLDYEIPTSVGKVGARLDVRGEGACCVLPTPGTSYWWDPHKNPTTTLLALAPSWLVPPPPARPASTAPPPRPLSGEINPYGANAINSAVSRIFTAPDGQQTTTLNREAYAVGQPVGAGVVPERIGLAALMHGALAMPSYDRWRPWRRNEIERSVKRSFDAGMRRPRDGR
jgi:hypothetical protein